MKFLLIFLAMAGAAAGAYHSWQSRNDYIQAALLSEAFNLTAPIKLRVADYFQNEGRMPHDNRDADLPAPRSLYGTSVKRVAIERGGILRVDFAERIGEQSMTFTPTLGPLSGVLLWTCGSDSIAPGVLEKLNPSCDYLPASAASRLMLGIANQDRDAVEVELAKGADVNAVISGNSPLMLAARIGNTEIIRRLLDADARIDNATLGAERRTPLMVAIASGNADAAHLLLSRGASGSQKDYQGKTALEHARDVDQRLGGTRFTLLVSAHFNPRFAGRQTAPVPDTRESKARKLDPQTLFVRLNRAAQECHVSRLSSLLHAEGELEKPELLDGKPLASYNRKPACAARLARWVRTKPAWHRGLQASFDGALARCDLRASDTMLRDHPSLEVNGNPGKASHFQTAVRAGCTDVVGLLIREKSLDGRLDDHVIGDAIDHAPAPELLRLVSILIDAGANVNVPNAAGQSPLVAAIALEQPVVAKYLIDAGADVNAASAAGSYPIIEATKKGYAHLVSQLIADGARVDAQDTMGRTALLVAVANRQQRLVAPLVRAGANTRARDTNGINAMVLAESRNQRQITRLLSASSE